MKITAPISHSYVAFSPISLLFLEAKDVHCSPFVCSVFYHHTLFPRPIRTCLSLISVDAFPASDWCAGLMSPANCNSSSIIIIHLLCFLAWYPIFLCLLVKEIFKKIHNFFSLIENSLETDKRSRNVRIWVWNVQHFGMLRNPPSYILWNKLGSEDHSTKNLDPRTSQRIFKVKLLDEDLFSTVCPGCMSKCEGKVMKDIWENRLFLCWCLLLFCAAIDITISMLSLAISAISLLSVALSSNASYCLFNLINLLLFRELYKIDNLKN